MYVSRSGSTNVPQTSPHAVPQCVHADNKVCVMGLGRHTSAVTALRGQGKVNMCLWDVVGSCPHSLLLQKVLSGCVPNSMHTDVTYFTLYFTRVESGLTLCTITEL